MGVELGQLAALIVALPLLNWLVAHVGKPRIALIVMSALVAHTAWHWLADRWVAFREYAITVPAFDAAFGAGLLRAAMLALIAAGGAWLAGGLVRRLAAPGSPGTSATTLDTSLGPTPGTSRSAEAP